jgi:phage head maturation protease
MVDCARISLDRPLQRSTRHSSRKGEAIINSGLNLRGFFVVVPSHELHCGQLFSRVVEVVDFRKCLQPGLAALLPHDPARTPGRQRIVETFVGSTHGLFFRVRHSRVIEACQIALAIIVGGRHHPGIAAVTEHVSESAVILKKVQRLSR